MDARDFSVKSPFVDWMVYLNRLDIDPSQLPASASVIKVDDKGSIIITQDVPVDANDQSHVQNVRSVEAALIAGAPIREVILSGNAHEAGFMALIQEKLVPVYSI
jgi:hypothetical protein